MMNDQDLKKIFAEHKIDVPDNGFSKRITVRLPPRKNSLPQIVMIVCVVAGLGLTLAIQGIYPIFEQINDLVRSIANLQAPTLISVLTYIGFIATFGLIGYSVSHADVG